MFQVKQTQQTHHNTKIKTVAPIFLALFLTLCTFFGLIFGVREQGQMAIYGGIGSALALVSLFTHPLVPFALYFPCLFFSETGIPGIPISPNQALGVLFFASWIAYLLRGRTISISLPATIFLACCSAYFAFSAITGESEERGPMHFKAVVTYLFMALALASSLRSEKAIRALAWIITIATAMAALQGLSQAFDKAIFSSFSGKWSDSVRVSGTAKNSIVYGWNMLYAFPFAFFLFTRHQKNFYKWVALGLGLFSLLIAMLTFNRQTFVLVGIVVFASTLLSRYPNKKRVITLVCALGTIALVAILPMVVSRFMTVENIKRDASYLERRDQLIVAMEMYHAKPVIGIGLGSYPDVWKQHLPKDYSTYNMQYDYKSERYPDFGYLQLLSETGIIGLCIAIMMMGFVIAQSYRIRRMSQFSDNDFAFNLASMTLTLGIFWIFSNAMQDTFLYVRIWFLLGIMALLTPKNLSLTSAKPLPVSKDLHQ